MTDRIKEVMKELLIHVREVEVENYNECHALNKDDEISDEMKYEIKVKLLKIIDNLK